MNSMRDVMIQAKKLGVACTTRTFWHYHKLGLLPGGQKIPGYGNVIFFPQETATRLWLIMFLTKELKFKISDLRRFPWAEYNVVAASRKLPKEIIFAARRDLEDARVASLKKTVDNIFHFLNENAAVPAASVAAIGKSSPSVQPTRASNRQEVLDGPASALRRGDNSRLLTSNEPDEDDSVFPPLSRPDRSGIL